MIGWAAGCRALAIAGVIGFTWSGCFPLGGQSTKAQTRAYLQKAQELKKAFDYEGAAKTYRKILRMNPRSARAHFELGLLYDSELEQPAAAIYHYQHFKRLEPDSPWIEEYVDPSIRRCKRVLARGVTLEPVTRKMQQRLESLNNKHEKLVEANEDLRSRNEKLKQSMKRLEQKYARAEARIGQLEARLDGENGPPSSAEPVEPSNTESSGEGRFVSSTSGGGGQSGDQVTYHTVKASETMYGIAQHYGVEVEEIQTANPDVVPTRMPEGTRLKIPYP